MFRKMSSFFDDEDFLNEEERKNAAETILNMENVRSIILCVENEVRFVFSADYAERVRIKEEVKDIIMSKVFSKM